MIPPTDPEPAPPPPAPADDRLSGAPLDRRAAALVLGAMLAFSFMPVFARAAAAPVLGVSAWRAFFVFLSFALAAALREGSAARRPSPETLRLGLMLGVAQALASATFIGGYALTTVANTIFLHNLAPIVVFPLAYLAFKERPRGAALAGVGIAVLGVALLSGVSLFQVAHFASARFLLGDGLALLSAVGYGAVLVLTRASRRANTPLFSTLAIAWLVAAVLLAGVGLVAGELAIGLPALGWTLGLALICTTVPFFLLNLGMRRLGAGTTAVLSLAEVLFATVQGALLFGEGLAPVGWIGGALVAAGVLYALLGDGDGDPEGDPARPPGLSAAARQARGPRLALALVALNVGAVVALMQAGAGAHLLAGVGALALARLGPGVAGHGLSPRAARLLSWAGAGLTAAAVFGVGGRALELSAASPLVAGIALLYVVVDGWLAAQEPAAERDPAATLRLGAAGLALAQGLALLEHPQASLALQAGALVALLGAAAPLAAGLSGRLTAGVGPTALRREGALAGLVQPRPAAGVALVLWLSGGLSSVGPGEVAVVERLGAPQATLARPGLLVHAPPPIDRLRRLQVGAARRAPLLSGGALLLCGDQSLLALEASLHYEIEDPHAFLYGAVDAEAALVELGRAALVDTIARRSHEEVLTTGRAEIEAAVLADTDRAVRQVGLGLRVRGVQLGTTRIPAPALGAFLEVISAAEARLTEINEAQAFAARVLPAAGGEAVTRIAAAHGRAAEQVARARAQDALLRALSTGGAAAPALTRARLRAEGLEQAWGGKRLLVLPDTVTYEGLLPQDRGQTP